MCNYGFDKNNLLSPGIGIGTMIGIMIGILFLLSALTNDGTNSLNSFKKDAVKRGFARWEVNEDDGSTIFTWEQK